MKSSTQNFYKKIILRIMSLLLILIAALLIRLGFEFSFGAKPYTGLLLNAVGFVLAIIAMYLWTE